MLEEVYFQYSFRVAFFRKRKLNGKHFGSRQSKKKLYNVRMSKQVKLGHRHYPCNRGFYMLEAMKVRENKAYCGRAV
jgi:hypothetical protein